MKYNNSKLDVLFSTFKLRNGYVYPNLNLVFPRFYCFFIKFFLMIIYFWERQSASGGGAQREGDTEYEAGSRLLAIITEPDAGLKLMNLNQIMTWTKVGCLADWATQVPLLFSSWDVNEVWDIPFLKYFPFYQIFLGLVLLENSVDECFSLWLKQLTNRIINCGCVVSFEEVNFSCMLYKMTVTFLSIWKKVLCAYNSTPRPPLPNLEYLSHAKD